MSNSGATSDAMLSNPRVLLIEDDEAVARAFVRGFERAGMQVAWAGTGNAGMAMKASFRPDVVLVDLTLPDVSGVTLIGRLAEARDCGVIVVSGMGDEADRIVGLELGADDYIAKPPAMREMIARIRAVHRRVNTRHDRTPAPAPSAVLSIGPIRINLQHRTVHTADGRRLNLTSAEFAALETLAAAAGQPVSRDRLSEAALRRAWRAEDRSVDQLVFNLRQKLPPDESGTMLIQSIRGSGYWLRAPEVAPDAPPPRADQNAWVN
ncbi:MAG TPA: response regulator transcription factor [Acetobacteraceae bacterium]